MKTFRTEAKMVAHMYIDTYMYIACLYLKRTNQKSYK